MQNITTYTSTITHGNMSLRFGKADAVVQSRKNFLQEHNLTWEDSICMRCDHGAEIIVVDRSTVLDEYRMIDAEVLITQDKNLTLMLPTADCLPTTLYDPATQTLALAHFSRQTTADKLPEKTIQFMQEHFNVDPKNLLIEAGPHIHKKSYRFPTPLQNVSETIQPHLTIENDFTYIDVASAHNAQLIAVGVLSENITLSKTDTATSKDHYSHFASTQHGKEVGRIVTISKIISST